MNYVRKITQQTDYRFVLACCVLIFIGLLALYSATHHSNAEQYQIYFVRQIWWLLIGLGFLYLVYRIEPYRWYHLAYIIYGGGILGLIAVLLVGRGQGAGRWLVWGVFHVQPAEIAKVGVLLVLARFLADFSERELNQVFPVLSAFLLVMLPLILVLQQPDLSSALVFGAIVLPMLYWAGLSLFAIFTIIAPVVTILAAFQIYTFFAVMVIITIVLIISRRGVKTVLLNFFVNVLVGIWPPYIWNHLHQYQQKRILAFLGLEFDPQGSGYQVIQSQVAIGSGGIVGKGFLHGTQTRLHFLPAQHTDFIVSVVGEEFGFLGILLVLGLFLYLLLYAVRVAERSDDRFTSLLIIGIVGIFAFHILINVGMTVGIMPVTGLPLPFLSYGGSFLVVCLIFLGLILRIERQ